MTTAIEQTLETYGSENWGAGYFDVNRKGNLIVRPVEGDPRSADLKEIIDDLPYLEEDDVAESLRYAAEAVRERELPLTRPA